MSDESEDAKTRGAGNVPGRSMAQVLGVAARGVALQQARWAGALLAVLVASTFALTPAADSTAQLVWALLTLIWAGLLGGLPRSWVRKRSSTQLAAGLLLTLALAMGPAALSDGSQRMTLLWLHGLFSLALAAAMAAHQVSVGMITAGALAASLWGGLEAAPYGLAFALACAATAQRVRRNWGSTLARSMALSDRLRQMERKRDAALKRDRDKSRFLAIASHDLRQPVHALGLFAATLHKRLSATADGAITGNLVRSIEGLERSFTALLDLSRLDEGVIPTHVQAFMVGDLFRRLQMQYGGQAELAGLGLRFSPGGKAVISDAQLLERILANLIQNAVRYTVKGGVVVVARTTRSHLNLEVWDTGCGISEEELPHIFDEFYQVGRGERDRTQGLGMGLAIVKRLTLLLGHRLEVVSVPGRGSMFRVGVPRGSLVGVGEESGAADTLPMVSELAAAEMVLVIDDEESIREGLVMLLQEWGYQVIAAANGDEAERALAALEGRVDLVLSDLHLGPGPGGNEVVASLRRLSGRHIPAILVTGDTAGAQLKTVTGGTDPVLFKPVQAKELRNALRMAFTRLDKQPLPSKFGRR
ncbi:hybrid sensor histidine kinase/response regulator [Roseateles sp. NT4]